jgi:hypothetical protein
MAEAASLSMKDFSLPAIEAFSQSKTPGSFDPGVS